MEILERKKMIEYARSYLRKNDFSAGYIPQLIYDKEASEWWSLYWFCVRKLDDAFDNSVKISGADLEGFLEYLNNKDASFRGALKLFLEETHHIIPRSLLEEIYSSVAFEKKYYHDGKPQSLATYIQLIHKRSVTPFFINGLINGIDKDSPYLLPLCTTFSRAIQLLDDMMDMHIDIEKGRLYITNEELRLLKLKPNDVLKQPQAIAALRNKLFMELSLIAYQLNVNYWDTSFGLHIRSVLEGAWKMIEDGRAIPLPKSIFSHDLYYSHYVGATSLPYDAMPVNEDLKYYLFHEPSSTFLRKYKASDFYKAQEMLMGMTLDTSSILEKLKVDYSALITNELKAKIAQDAREFYHVEDGYGLPLAVQESLNNSLESLQSDFNHALQHKQFQPFMAKHLNNLIGFQRSINTEILSRTRKTVDKTIPDASDSARKTSEKMIDLVELAQEHSMKFFEEITNSLFAK